jgi:hypothetical protein
MESVQPTKAGDLPPVGTGRPPKASLLGDSGGSEPKEQRRSRLVSASVPFGGDPADQPQAPAALSRRVGNPLGAVRDVETRALIPDLDDEHVALNAGLSARRTSAVLVGVYKRLVEGKKRTVDVARPTGVHQQIVQLPPSLARRE